MGTSWCLTMPRNGAVISLFLPLLTLISTASTKSCTTVDDELCVFPFTFKNVTYAGCTKAGNPGGVPWCSTKVSEDGIHQKGKFGDCNAVCTLAEDRLRPVCSELEVTEEEDDFASGKYTVSSSLTRGGRAVYENKQNELFIFWLDSGAGWGLGYEDGIQSGGVVIYSGPQVSEEPWQGKWKERDFSVSCSSKLDFHRNMKGLPEVTKKCISTEVCVSREQCPSLRERLINLRFNRKDLREEEIEDLTQKVCNQKEKALCCPISECEPSLDCKPLSECPTVERGLHAVKGNNLDLKTSSGLFKSLKRKVCSKNSDRFCC